MFISPDGNHLAVAWRQDLANLIPHAKPFDWMGQQMLLMPNNTDEARVCRNLGVQVPPPVLTRYDWRGLKPWDIQRTTTALLTESPRAYVLNTMGTGKTLAAAFAADWLASTSAVSPWLITAPLSTLSLVWEAELFKLLPRAKVSVLYGSKDKRLKALAAPADFYIVNHHGLIMLADHLVGKFRGVIIDELAVFRNRSTSLWKAANAIVNGGGVDYAWGLTGSPTPNSPLDAWAQVRLLTPGRVPRTSTAFRDTVMRQVSTFKWAPRPDATAIVHKAMQPAVRFTRDDVMELPETTYVDREVKLEGEGAVAYKMLYDKMRMATSGGESITAANEGVLQSKLLQVALGYIYTDSRGTYNLPSDTRKEALLEIVEECERKVIVFVPYIHALVGVTGFLAKHGYDVATVSGDTPRAARDSIFRRFQHEELPRVLVAHPQCMSHGLTLTSANTIVWYGPTNSLDIYEQANARITRPGQTSKSLIVHLSGTAVERAVYRRLRGKAKMQGLLLELFKAQELDY